MARLRLLARRYATRAAVTGWRALRESVEDRIHRDAAQIAFFALLSFVPLAMLMVGLFGLAFDEDEVRRRLVSTVFEGVPLSSEGDRARIEASVLDALGRTGRLGPFTVVVLVVAASGVMAALRHTINVAYDIEERPPLLARKALDVALVAAGIVVLLLALSLGLARESVVGDELLGFALGVAVICALYALLPTQRPRLRDVIPGAVVAVLGLLVAQGVLELYFDHLTDLGALYGSLGALMALLLFTYAAALAVLLGAEVASEYGRLEDDDALADRLGRGLGRVRARLPAGR